MSAVLDAARYVVWAHDYGTTRELDAAMEALRNAMHPTVGTGSFGRVSLHDEAMALIDAWVPKTATVADLDRIYLERTQPLEPLPRPMVLGDLYAYQQYGWHQFGWPMVPVEWWQ